VILDRRGFALIAALWFVVAVAAVTLHWGLRSREARRLAGNVAAHAAASAAAEAGLAHVWANLDLALRPEWHSFDGDPERLLDPWWDLRAAAGDTAGGIATGRWWVSVEDAGSRLNLNGASEEELRLFFMSLPLDAGRADRIAQAIADWRDEDHLHRPRGAERDWYERQGRLVLPRNGPFRSLDELRHVKEVSPEVYARCSRYLTLAGNGRINVMRAPPAVLLALPGIGPEAVAAIHIHRRERRPPGTIGGLAEALPPAAQATLLEHLPALLERTTVQTEEILLRSHGIGGDNSVPVAVEAVVFRRPGSSSIRSWRVAP
jgi:general secretion pathway protein K